MITFKQQGRRGYGMDLGALGVQCDPVPDASAVAAYYGFGPGAAPTTIPGSGHVRAYDPYQDDAQLKGSKALGLVYNPAGVAKRSPDCLGPWLDSDPGYHTTKDGTDAFYSDTQFGAVSIPTDLDWPQGGGCYGPVRWGWIDLPKSDLKGSWLSRRSDPRDAHDLHGALGDTTEAVDQLTAASNRAFWLALVSTSAVVTLAGVNLFRLWKEGRKPLSGWRKRR